MGNLFLCSGGEQEKTITRYKNIFSRTISSATNGALNIRSYLPEGVDFTKLTVDNFVIDSISLENKEVYCQSSDITEIFASAKYSPSSNLIKFSEYNNVTGQLRIQSSPPSLVLLGSETGDISSGSVKSSDKITVVVSVGLIV